MNNIAMQFELNLNSVQILKIHYESLCLLQPHYPATRTPKQLLYNYITTIPWKYKKLMNKMPCHKIREFFCSCKLIVRDTSM